MRRIGGSSLLVHLESRGVGGQVLTKEKTSEKGGRKGEKKNKKPEARGRSSFSDCSYYRNRLRVDPLTTHPKRRCTGKHEKEEGLDDLRNSTCRVHVIYRPTVRSSKTTERKPRGWRSLRRRHSKLQERKGGLQGGKSGEVH